MRQQVKARSFIFIILFILLSGSVTYAEKSTIKVVFENKELPKAVPTLIENGVEYLPLTEVISLFNLNKEWDSLTRKVILSSGNRRAHFYVDIPLALVNNSLIKLDESVKLSEGTLLVPLGFVKVVVSRLREVNISWDSNYRILTVTNIVPPKVTVPEVAKRSTTPGHTAQEKEKPSISSLRLKTIVIDPGHGGRDPGAIGPTGLKEKYVALDISLRLKNLLEKGLGVKVILTRTGDYFLSLEERTAIANKNNADIFLSIHSNASYSPKLRGFETYFLDLAKDEESRAVAALENSAQKWEEKGGRNLQDNDIVSLILASLNHRKAHDYSQDLAAFVQIQLDKEFNQSLSQWVEEKGVKQAPFIVLMGATMPAILIEAAFISNRIEEKKLKDPLFRERIARAIYSGISLYKVKYEKEMMKLARY